MDSESSESAEVDLATRISETLHLTRRRLLSAGAVVLGGVALGSPASIIGTFISPAVADPSDDEDDAGPASSSASNGDDTPNDQSNLDELWRSILDLRNLQPLCFGKYDPYEVGVPVKDAYGDPVQDPYSASKFLMSPTSDLSSVVKAGQQFGAAFYSQLREDRLGAFMSLAYSLGSNFLWGGTFDYQRPQGIQGAFYIQYRDVSSFQIGVFTYYAGLPKELVLAGDALATRFGSSNREPDFPWIPAQNREMIELGYSLSEQGYIGNGQRPAEQQIFQNLLRVP